MIQVWIPGEPKALKRHRSFRMGTQLRQVDPSKSDKADLLAKAMENRPPAPLDVPLNVTMRFVFGRPKSHYRTGKNAHLLKDSAPMWHTSRPDLDNLAKLVKDALNGIYWKDDSIIASMHLEKAYGLSPGIDLIIREAE